MKELVGFAALVSVLIEVLKKFGLVPDGYGGLAAAIGNIIVFAIAAIGGFYGWDLGGLDSLMAMIAEILAVLVGMFGISLVTHKIGKAMELPLYR
jgi:hypothetical protein